MKYKAMTRRHLLKKAGLGVLGMGSGIVYRPGLAGAIPVVDPLDRIHLGFIGLGGMGRSHLDRLLRNHPETIIVAGSYPGAQRGRAAKRYRDSSNDCKIGMNFPPRH